MDGGPKGLAFSTALEIKEGGCTVREGVYGGPKRLSSQIQASDERGGCTVEEGKNYGGPKRLSSELPAVCSWQLPNIWQLTTRVSVLSLPH